MKQLKLWIALGGVLMLISAFAYVDIRAFNRGYNAKVAEVVKADNNAHSIAKNVQNKNIRKTDADIQKALEKWYRD